MADLVGRVREFARTIDSPSVSSAYLSSSLGVDPRTVAAALRRLAVRPKDVGGLRVYAVADLRGLPDRRLVVDADVLDRRDPDPDPGPGLVPGFSDPAEPAQPVAPPQLPAGLPVFGDAVSALSAALGHDATPVLKAAGLL